MEHQRRLKGPATTLSLYDQYLARFNSGEVTNYQLLSTLIPEEDFYDSQITPPEMRRQLADASDPTFRGKNGLSHCVKKSTSVIRS